MARGDEIQIVAVYYRTNPKCGARRRPIVSPGYYRAVQTIIVATLDAFHEIPFPDWAARRVMHQCFTKRAGMQANKGEEHTIPAYAMQPKWSGTRHALMLSVDDDTFQVQSSIDLFQRMCGMFIHVPGQALLC